MSKLITIAQKKGLRNIGFDFDSRCYCGGAMECVCEYMKDEHKLITVSEALDWIREEKRIVCFVDVIYHPIEKKAMYLGKILSESGLIIQKKTSDFDTHPLAESALLNAILTYLEERTDV